MRIAIVIKRTADGWHVRIKHSGCMTSSTTAASRAQAYQFIESILQGVRA